MSGSNTIPIVSAKCASCGYEHAPFTKAHALAMVCTECKTYFTLGNWSDEQATFLEVYEPHIPIGARGRINNVLYQVVGFVVKRDKRYRQVKWREYFLFNPKHGVAFLSEYDGHWNFIKPVNYDPKGKSAGTSFYHEGNEYQLYQKYRADILYARGEFFFDIFRITDIALNYEYICPPYLFGQEVSERTLLWYKGEYMQPSDVAAAFNGLPFGLPSREGIGATQPVLNVGFSGSALVSLTVLLISVVIGIQVVLSKMADEKMVFNKTYYRRDLPENEKLFVSDPFDLTAASQSVTVKVKAPIDNDWFFTDLALVNENTGEEYNFSKDVEYYHGYEDGSSWSEGSTIGEVFLSRIPGGPYHLIIYPDFNNCSSFEISVTRDVAMPSNMLFTILGIIVFPIIFFIYRHNREMSRWSESDYSPYHSDE